MAGRERKQPTFYSTNREEQRTLLVAVYANLAACHLRLVESAPLSAEVNIARSNLLRYALAAANEVCRHGLRKAPGSAAFSPLTDDTITQALAIDAKHPKCLLRKGRTLRLMGDTARARETLQALQAYVFGRMLFCRCQRLCVCHAFPFSPCCSFSSCNGRLLRLEPEDPAVRAELAKIKSLEQKHDHHMRSALKGLFG